MFPLSYFLLFYKN